MAPRRGPVDTGVDAGRTALKRAEPGRPGRVRVRSLAARTAAVLLAAFAALLALPLQAQAQVNVPDDWALIPAGVEVGDSFRLLFLSSTKRNGSSSSIATYNTFIQNRVAAGHADIQEHSSQFKAVGCTTAVDARDNTGTTGTGVPIYWLNGNKVADDNADFYDGNWDDEANDKNENGSNGPNTSNTGNYPLTGCDHDGTEDFRALGTSTSIRVGRPNSSTSGNGPLYGSTVVVSTSQNRPMYGLSAVFTVEASASTDATLSGLALENADDDSTIALNQTFATATKSYTASVLNGVDEITVLPETTDDGATVEYLDGSDATITDSDTTKDDQQVELDVGANTIKVKVTAEDDATTESYTVVVTRAPAAGGICGRTLAVQTAILGKISGVSACADVTTAHLAAITGTLDLASKSISALAEGDFAGLTALTTLNLTSNDLTGLPAGVFDPLTELTSLNLILNDLTELPAGVFDTLTKLTSLDLSNNELSFLRAGVFDELTMLLSLSLDSNQLSALPDRVFEKLTLLVTILNLSENPGTDDFVPTAMAAATPATIPTTGGDVVLDAAGSGGAWGTNVTYAWALTDPSSGVTVTYAPDAASAMTTATVPGSLTDGSTLTFTLTVTGIGFPTPETDTVEVVTRAEEDATAPSPESAEVATSGTSVTVTFSEGLDVAAENLPAAVVNAFTVTADGVALDIDRISSPATNALLITLPTGTTISENQTVKVSYDKTVAGADALEDAADNEVASFTDFAVTNNSTVAPNNPPVFPSSTAARNVAENSPAGTDVGNAVTATDDDNDTLTYTLEGIDVASFDLVTISGSAQIRTKSGVTYDHETKSSYAVTVKADDSNGGSDTIAVTITVTDVNEAPARPAFPSVASVANSTTSLAVTWTAPSNTGPPISNYDLRYRQGTSGGWTNGPQNVTGTSATISSLSANTLYQVQVRATNNEGDSLWSPSGSGRTNMAGNTAPTFPSSTATRNVAENSPAGTDVGNAVTATDDDNDPLTYTIEGTDAASFTIVTTAGSAQIRTRSGVPYDREAQPSYTVIVKADDGNGGSDTVTVTINLTDVDEPPLAPAAPTVTATPNTTDSLSVSWRAPSDAGRPAIDSYDLQYREGTTGNWTNGPQNVSGTSATISGLTADPAAYQVQVRATNDEGDSRWSPPGRIRTTPQEPPEPSVLPPSIPRNLLAEPGDRQVTLSWGAPSSDGGARIVRYEYRLQVGDGAVGRWQIIRDRPGEESPVVTRRHRVVGLDNGTRYTFQLRAVNNRWASPATESVSATPKPEPEPEPVPALPLLGQLLLALGLAGAGAMRLARPHRGLRAPSIGASAARERC